MVKSRETRGFVQRSRLHAAEVMTEQSLQSLEQLTHHTQLCGLPGPLHHSSLKYKLSVSHSILFFEEICCLKEKEKWCVGGKELVYHSKESYYRVVLQGHSIHQIKHDFNTWIYIFF